MTTKVLAKIGDEVRDGVTGFTGTVVARTEWLNGCIRLTVQPGKLNKEGGVKATETFDIEQLIVTKAGKHAPKPAERRTNGPMPSTPRGM